MPYKSEVFVIILFKLFFIECEIEFIFLLRSDIFDGLLALINFIC